MTHHASHSHQDAESVLHALEIGVILAAVVIIVSCFL